MKLNTIWSWCQSIRNMAVCKIERTVEGRHNYCLVKLALHIGKIQMCGTLYHQTFFSVTSSVKYMTINFRGTSLGLNFSINYLRYGIREHKCSNACCDSSTTETHLDIRRSANLNMDVLTANIRKLPKELAVALHVIF